MFLENRIQKDKPYLVESACEIDNNLPSSVVINYLKFANVTYRRSGNRQIKHATFSHINTTQLIYITMLYKTSSSILICFLAKEPLNTTAPAEAMRGASAACSALTMLHHHS